MAEALQVVHMHQSRPDCWHWLIYQRPVEGNCLPKFNIVTWPKILLLVIKRGLGRSIKLNVMHICRLIVCGLG